MSEPTEVETYTFTTKDLNAVFDRVEIRLKDFEGGIFIDGKRVEGVQRVVLEADCLKPPKITLDLIPTAKRMRPANV